MSELTADAAIQQLNLGYDAQQDRLLLKVGLADDSEITVWLTRRVVKALWALLQGSSALPMVAPDVFTPATQAPLENFARETKAQRGMTEQTVKLKMDFSETYQANRAARMQEPMLANDCQIISLGNAQSTLELQGAGGKTVRIALSLELTQALGNMLLLATREAVWDL